MSDRVARKLRDGKWASVGRVRGTREDRYRHGQLAEGRQRGAKAPERVVERHVEETAAPGDDVLRMCWCIAAEQQRPDLAHEDIALGRERMRPCFRHRVVTENDGAHRQETRHHASVQGATAGAGASGLREMTSSARARPMKIQRGFPSSFEAKIIETQKPSRLTTSATVTHSTVRSPAACAPCQVRTRDQNVSTITARKSTKPTTPSSVRASRYALWTTRPACTYCAVVF